jgi:uncharacterized membrane protein
MTTWLPRGLVFAAGMVFLRLVQGTLINASPTNAGTISFLLVLVFGVAAAIWGLLDGLSDARANPDPDRRRDLAMRWLAAGLFAGALSGLLSSIIAMFDGAVYAEGPVTEMTVFAAFTALTVFVPAIFAVSVGRKLIDRKRPDEPRHHSQGDVFESVLEDGYEDPSERVSVAGRREESWRQESREAVREVHETVQQRKYDLNRED